MPIRKFRSYVWSAATTTLLALLVAGCGGAPALHYTVDFAHRDSLGVPVTLEVSGVPRDSLVLEGYLQSPAMTVRDVSVTASGGSAPVAQLALRTLSDGRGGEADFPVVRLDGPLPSKLVLHYRVALGTREGNEHTGFTGRCNGYAGDRFAFAGGRELFLVPSPVGRMRAIDVRFELPAGWSAVVPWTRERDAWRVGVAGAAPVEDLLWSALAFGKFDETTLERFGTTFRFETESGIGGAVRDSALRAYTAVVRRVTDAFGRPLGKSFTIIVTPPHEAGDEIVPEGWATSVGGTFAPLTTNRARQLAESVIDAYLAQAPYKTTVSDTKERWLVDGVSRLLPWRALESAGLSARGDYTRWLASDFTHALEDNEAADLEWNLENVPHSDRETVLAHEVLPPLALLRIDEKARALSGGTDSLETVLRRVFAGRAAGSIWSAVPKPSDAAWAALRDTYVRGARGGRAIEDDAMFHAASPSEAPQPARGATVSRLTLALTGNSYGYLENCGCKVNQAGGVARRSTMLQRLRREAPLLALDAGNTLMRPDHFATPDFLALEEEKIYLRSMARMGYPLAVVGPAELAYGLGRFRDAAETAGFPFVIANARDAFGALADSARVVEAGGVRVGVIGLLEPQRGPWANDVLERHLGDAVMFEDPIAALRRVLPGVRAKADVVIAMGELSPPTVQRIVAEFPDVDVVVSTDEEASVPIERVGAAAAADTSIDAMGFYGRTLVLFTTQSSYGLNGATLGLDATKHIASAEMFASWLGDSVADDPAVRGELTRFYNGIGRTQAAQASVPPLFADDPAMLNGDWIGAAKCQPCHAQEHAQWKDTDHASAYKTLLDAHRHYQPRCIVCHVVGYGTPKGYTMGSADTHLVGVQCELCHGPGAAHSAQPSKQNIRRKVPEQVCLECHTPDHSDHFVYDDKLPKVVHQEIKTIDAMGGK